MSGISTGRRKDRLHSMAPEPFQDAWQLGQPGCPAQAHGLAILPLPTAVALSIILALFSLCILLIAVGVIICTCHLSYDCSSTT